MKKNAVAATKAIEISQKDIPTKSSWAKFAAAAAKLGETINAALATIIFVQGFEIF